MKTNRPSLFQTTAETHKANEFLKLSGTRLVEQARQNQTLIGENHELREKLSKATRREELLKIAMQASERGMIAPKQILSKVSQWDASNKSPEEYRELILNRGGSAFAESGESDTVKVSSGEDWVDPYAADRERFASILNA